MKFYLSHQTLVSKLSAPILAMAAFTFVVLTEISELGYVSLLMKVPVIVFPGNGFGVKTGNPLLLKLANASGPFKKEAIQYCVLICSSSLPGKRRLAATYASLAAG